MRVTVDSPVAHDSCYLRRLSPLAWGAMIGLSMIVNALSETGCGLENRALQSMMIVTLVAGIVALAGTAQAIERWHVRGAYARAAVAVAGVITVSAGMAAYGIACYLG